MGGGRGSGGQRHRCGKNKGIFARVKMKLSTPGVAHDAVSRIIALERAEDCHGWAGAEAVVNGAHGFWFGFAKRKLE